MPRRIAKPPSHSRPPPSCRRRGWAPRRKDLPAS